MSNDVLLINAGYEHMKRVSRKKAVNMLTRKVAVIEEAIDGEFYGPYPMPKTIRLVRYVNINWRKEPPRVTRKRIFRRDNFTCAFKGCDRPAETIEHVLPKSRGGEKVSWTNLVAACFRCNNRKGNRTLKESGMSLKFEPYVPRWADVFA